MINMKKIPFQALIFISCSLSIFSMEKKYEIENKTEGLLCTDASKLVSDQKRKFDTLAEGKSNTENSLMMAIALSEQTPMIMNHQQPFVVNFEFNTRMYASSNSPARTDKDYVLELMKDTQNKLEEKAKENGIEEAEAIKNINAWKVAYLTSEYCTFLGETKKQYEIKNFVFDNVKNIIDEIISIPHSDPIKKMIFDQLYAVNKNVHEKFTYFGFVNTYQPDGAFVRVVDLALYLEKTTVEAHIECYAFEVLVDRLRENDVKRLKSLSNDSNIDSIQNAIIDDTFKSRPALLKSNDSQIPAEKTLDDLVNVLYTTMAGKDSGADSSTIFLCYPGIPITDSYFNDMYSLTNPKGMLSNLEHFSSTIADTIPNVKKYVWEPSLKKISTNYGMIVDSSNAIAKDFPESEQKRYNIAREKLYKKIKDPFDSEQEIEDKSPAYKQYESKQLAYEAAVANYNLQKSQFDLSTSDGQYKWSLVGGKFEADMKRAYREWESSNKAIIDQALAIMGSTLQGGATAEIARNKQIFEQSRRNGNWYPVYTFPDKWWDNKSSSWTKIETSSKKKYDHVEKHTESFGGEAGFSLGLFSIKGDAEKSTEHNKEEHASSNLIVSMELAQVTLERNWLNTEWFNSKNWYIADRDKGCVSSGVIKNNDEKNILPVIPNRMFVAKNIILTADWSRSTHDTMNQKIKGKANIGYGPFTISGKYEKSDSDITTTFDESNNSIKVSGMQIIGFGATCPIFSPPLDATNKMTDMLGLTSLSIGVNEHTINNGDQLNLNIFQNGQNWVSFDVTNTDNFNKKVKLHNNGIIVWYESNIDAGEILFNQEIRLESRQSVGVVQVSITQI